MKSHLSRAVLAAALVSLSGCAASKYYDAAVMYRSKNAHASLEYLALCLKEKPDHEEAKALALEIGRQLAADTAAKLDSLESAGKFEAAVAECDRMIVTSDLISKLPGNMSVFVDPDLRARAADKAANQFYEQGASLEAQDPKEAAVAFRRVIGFKRGYKDAQARYAKAREAAMIKLALPAFQAGTADARSLTSAATQKLRAALGALNMEFVTVVGDGAPADGRIAGRVDANFQDSGWQEERKAHRHEEPMWQKDQYGNVMYDQGGNPIPAVDAYGNQLMEVFEATWSVYSRSTAANVTVSYQVEMRDGSQPVSGSRDGSASDAKTYRSQIRGHVEAVRRSPTPGDLDLPDQKIEPRAPAQLAAGLIDGPCQVLAKQIFDHYR